MNETPSLEQVIQTLIEKQMVDVHTSLPAVVLSYDSEKQSVSVQPLIKHGHVNESGNRVTVDLPVINDVPVVFVGSGPVSLTWPIDKGHTGQLVFCQSSIDKWKVKGGKTDPGDDRRFNLSDAVFHPGLRDFAHKLSSAAVHATAMVITAPAIHAGGDRGLAFADHKHLDSTGAPTSEPISDAIVNPSFVPFPVPGSAGPPSLDTNPTHIGTSDSGTSILKGA